MARAGTYRVQVHYTCPQEHLGATVELSFQDEEQAMVAMNKAIQKLPIKARVITREEKI